MKPGWVALAALGLVLIVALSVLLTRAPQPDSDKLLRTLATVADGARRESPNRIVSVLSEDYSDDLGNSRASLRVDLMQGFWGPRRFEVLWPYVAIREANEETLSADVNFEIRQYSGDALVSTHTGRFDVTLVRDGRQLKVLRVEGLRAIVESVEASYGL